MIILNLSELFMYFCMISLITLFIIRIIHPNILNYITHPKGPQKIHTGIVPRLGGLVIFVSVLILYLFKIEKNVNDLLLYLLISSPIFILGFWKILLKLLVQF